MTLCIGRVTAFILVGNSASLEVLSLPLILRTVWRSLEPRSHSCSVIAAALWFCCFRHLSQNLSHLARNSSLLLGVVSVIRVRLVRGCNFVWSSGPWHGALILLLLPLPGGCVSLLLGALESSGGLVLRTAKWMVVSSCASFAMVISLL